MRYIFRIGYRGISECRHCCRTTLTPVLLPSGSSAQAWGADNMVFLTFGTGLGAGLILNGRLYTGTNDNAGEAGHIRLERFGPVGYGKAGSFEGFCSGGGIAKLGCSMALEALQSGRQLRRLRTYNRRADEGLFKPPTHLSRKKGRNEKA